MSNENNQIPYPAQNSEVQSAVASALEAEKKKKKKKKWIILAVILVIIIAGGALASGGNDSGKKVESLEANTSAADSAGQKAPSEKTTDAAPAAVEAGNSVTTDKLKISYISCNPDYTKYHEYSEPESGNKVVRAEFKFENISDTDVSLSGFECYADDKKCEEFYSTDDYASPALESVSPGRSFNAVVYYEVPKDAKDIEIEFEDNFWGNEKTIFVIK